MARRFEVLAPAEHEALEAARWYFEKDPRIALAFHVELTRAFQQIERMPETWPLHHHATRRFLLDKFPYEVVYRVYAEVILIVAVAHCKRSPGYWRNR